MSKKLICSHLANLALFSHSPDKTDEYLPKISSKDKTELRLVTPIEVTNKISKNLSQKKAPGYDLITVLMKELPRKGIVKLTYLINAAFRLRYVPMQWKVTEVIMILKPGKPPNEKTTYRQYHCCQLFPRCFEKLFLKGLKSIIEEKNLIPSHQFGFRNRHSTIDQVHRITIFSKRH